MQLKQKATLTDLPVFIRFVRECAEHNGFSSVVIQKIELALEEALVNIINYAYQDAGGDISIECQCTDKKIIIQIADWGLPFDLLAQEDPDTSLSLEEREIGGLGIFLVKQMMDELEYQRENGQNILTLTKLNEEN